jgi:Ankyrin repeat
MYAYIEGHSNVVAHLIILSGNLVISWVHEVMEEQFTVWWVGVPVIAVVCLQVLGRSALMCASMEGHSNIVAHLLAAPGININLADNVRAVHSLEWHI